MSWSHHRYIAPRARGSSAFKPAAATEAPRPPRLRTAAHAHSTSSPSSSAPTAVTRSSNALRAAQRPSRVLAVSSAVVLDCRSALLRQLSAAVWLRVLAFLEPLPSVEHAALACTCRSLRRIAQSRALLRTSALVAAAAVPSVSAFAPTTTRPLHISQPSSTPPRGRSVAPPLPSTVKLQRSLILQAASAGEPVDAVISEPWWQLDQTTVDTMRSTLINLLTPPRSPSWSLQPRLSSALPPSPSSLPLSPREVNRWHAMMRHVDRGYVKQLRRRRLRDKRRMGVRGEEVDDIARLERSLSTERMDDSPSLSASFASTNLASPLPSHCFAEPPVPYFLPDSPPSTVSFWRDQVLPRWADMSAHVLTVRVWGKEGIPAACRRDVWRTRLGNQNAVTETVFRQHWRGSEAADDGGEESKTEEDENGSSSAAATLSTPNGSKRASMTPQVSSPTYSSSSTSAPSSPSSPATPLPDALHAFSLPAVALLAAESSLSSQLTQLHDAQAAAPAAPDHIYNDLVRMFDEAHLDDIADVDSQRSEAELPPLMSTLHDTLATFAAYAPESSYVQGMNYMLCLLLLYMSPFEAFVALNSLLTHDWYAAYVSMNVTAMQSRCQLLQSVLRHNLPALASHLVQLPPDCYFIEWMLTFYVQLLSFASTSRLMDAYLLHGEEVIYRTAVALLMAGERRLLGMDLGGCSQWLRGGMKEDGQGIDEDELWRLMAKVNLPPTSKAFFSKSKAALNS